MSLGQHITTLRKGKKISQNDLGKQVGTSGDIIGRYERDEVKPSIEVVIKIADALDTSIDFLVGKTSVEVDKDTLKRLQEIEQLTNEDQKHLFALMDAFLRDAKAKKAYQ